MGGCSDSNDSWSWFDYDAEHFVRETSIDDEAVGVHRMGVGGTEKETVGATERCEKSRHGYGHQSDHDSTTAAVIGLGCLGGRDSIGLRLSM